MGPQVDGRRQVAWGHEGLNFLVHARAVASDKIIPVALPRVPVFEDKEAGAGDILHRHGAKVTGTTLGDLSHKGAWLLRGKARAGGEQEAASDQQDNRHATHRNTPYGPKNVRPVASSS